MFDEAGTANGPHPADGFIRNQKVKVRIPAIEFPPALVLDKKKITFYSPR